MKITKTQLRQIIKEELEKISEDREDHIKGITAKIKRLGDAVDHARRGIRNMEAGAMSDDDLLDIRSYNEYFAKQSEIMNLQDKIATLTKQLEQLMQDKPGQLKRP